MDETCKNCRHCKELLSWIYNSDGSVKHETCYGYACDAFSYEGTVVWMQGIDKDIEGCEMWEERKDKN